ncbi:MAG: amino acid adenylation domain-containing protein, partial [Chitinophagaceae bacterium]
VQQEQNIDWGKITVLVYFAGILLLLLRLFFQLSVLKKILTGIASGQAFSFLNKKIVDPELPQSEVISHHEDIHIKQRHTYDILFFELLSIFVWFNPFIYLYKRTIRNIHEYLADEQAASFQGNKEEYALLLLSKAFNVDPHMLTNNFYNRSLIKKRILMLHKTRSKRTAILKYGMFVPLFGLTLVLSSSTIRKNQEILEVAESLPVTEALETVILPPPPIVRSMVFKFAPPNIKKDHDWNGFYKYLASKLRYPATAIYNEKQGNSVIKFVVKNGIVLNIGIVDEVGEGCETEAMRVLLGYPSFKEMPDGNYVVPVAFRLSGSDSPVINDQITKLDDHTHSLRITGHHLICDGWSMGVIVNELGKLYSAYVRKEIPVICPASTYSEFAIDQLNYTLTEEYQNTENFWIEQFRQLPPVLNLPTDFERPAVRTFACNRIDMRMDRSLVLAVRKMGARAGSSFVTTMLAATKVMLHHLCGQDDIVLGLPVAGQAANGSDKLIGHCVNFLPLRSYPSDALSFAEYLDGIKKYMFDAYDHQRFTFGSLLKKLPLPRDKSRLPLIPIVFNIDTAMNDGVRFEGVRHKLANNAKAFESFEIFMNATGDEETMKLEWTYNTQLFTAERISGMMNTFQELLRKVAADPSVKIGELAPIFKPADNYRYPGNDTAFEYPSASTLHSLISAQSALTAQSVAIRMGNTSFTYNKLETLSNQLAGHLVANGLKRGDVVGLAVERSPLTLVSMLAILKTGAAYVPLDVEYPQDRINYMLGDSAASILITSAKYAGRFETAAREMIIEDLVNQAGKYSVDFSQPGITEKDLAYILYTSGSTGKPKGVQIMHYNLVNFMCSMRNILSVKSSDRMLGLTTISFDISGMELYLPLISGASIELVSTETARDGFALLDLIKNTHPTIVQATPATWQMLIEAGWNTDTCIDTVCSGGEPLSRELAEKLIPRTKHLFNLYGPTETTIWSTAKKIAASDKLMTIGRPIGNTKIYILDPNGKPLGVNEQGEIYISGDGVGKGYLNQLTLTAEKFLADPFMDVAVSRMYRTGDLGKFLPDGDIQCLGRQDQQIKIRGYRIEPGEIEYCLSKQPSIRNVTVIAREDIPGDQRIVAYVVLDTVEQKDLAQLIPSWKQAVKNFLPAYMCPNDFVLLDKLPTTPNGKVDRKSLPKPERVSEEPKKVSTVQSRNQSILSAIWSKILNAPSSMVSELSVVALVFFLLFSIQFVVQLINIVCFANQNTMMTSLIGFLGSLLGLTIIYILTRTVEGRLLYLCLAIGVTPILIYIIFSLVLFNTTYKEFAPNFRFAKAKYVKDIIGLGFKFFIIQLGLIFFYNADNIIIAQTMGPTGVTPYNIAYKYFTVITMISGIIMTPLWPAFTQANIKGDTVWIKKMIKKMQKICLFVFLLSMVMLVVSPIVYNLWIGDKVHIPWMLSLVLAIYTSLNTYRTVYCYYANAVGKINVQLIIVLTAGVLNIPLGIFLGKLYGAVGVILATTILCFICHKKNHNGIIN